MIFTILGVAIAIVAVIIVLFNMHKPYLVLLNTGICSVVSAGIGYLFGVVFNMLLNELEEQSEGYAEFALGVMGNPQDRITTVTAVFLGVGIALIVVYNVIAIIRRAACRK